MPVIMICKNCNKEVSVVPSKVRQFCSKGCATSYRQRIQDPNFLNEEDELFSYLLGLFATDGCISQQKDKLEKLTIGLIDLELIERLHPIICPERKIYKGKKKEEHHSDMYSLISTNEEVISFLKDMGIGHNKTLNLRFPILEEENVRHFIRGAFDGDGCIYTNHNPKYGDYQHISFTTASESFATSLMEALRNNGFTPKYNFDSRAKHKAIYVKLYKQDEVKRFGEWIYSDAEWFLKRKKEAFYDDIV